ncbi:MAG: hypothetical protein FWD17_12585 [Polyangiaceae bacterium]|nr:hypothetical protein [Polyangiaceae bacterium]
MPAVSDSKSSHKGRVLHPPALPALPALPLLLLLPLLLPLALDGPVELLDGVDVPRVLVSPGVVTAGIDVVELDVDVDPGWPGEVVDDMPAGDLFGVLLEPVPAPDGDEHDAAPTAAAHAPAAKTARRGERETLERERMGAAHVLTGARPAPRLCR